MSKNKVLKNKIIETKLVEWRELKWLQGGLKEISAEAFEKLKQSLKSNDFIQPFNVWDGWILDGHHRLQALKQIEQEGTKIPNLLPASLIECENKKEASKLVLVYSSSYADITGEGLQNFMFENDLTIDDMDDVNIGAMEDLVGSIEVIESPTANEKAPTFTTNVAKDKTAFYINRIYGVISKTLAEDFANKFNLKEDDDEANGEKMTNILESLL